MFTISQKYIFSVHQITTSGRKIQYFSGRTRTKKYRSECTKTCHFKWKKSFFLGGGIALFRHLTPNKPFRSTPRPPPEFQPDLRHCLKQKWLNTKLIQTNLCLLTYVICMHYNVSCSFLIITIFLITSLSQLQSAEIVPARYTKSSACCRALPSSFLFIWWLSLPTHWTSVLELLSVTPNRLLVWWTLFSRSCN